MIHLKKISVTFMVLFAALFLICGPAAAANKILTAGPASGDIGATVSVPIKIDDPTGVGGIAFTMTYPPTVFEFIGLDPGGKVITKGDEFLPPPVPPAVYPPDQINQIKADLFYQVNDEKLGSPAAATGRVMVAAASAQALTGTNLILFNAKFKILSGNGAYPINVLPTIINNASAGYATPEPVAVLMGTTIPNAQGMYTDTNFLPYAATLVPGSITVTNASKFAISGTVTYAGVSPGSPAVRSTVVLKRSTANGYVFDAQTTESGTGTYSFANKPAGTYQIFVTSNDPNYYSSQSASFDLSGNYTVPAVDLKAPEYLTGSVTINGGYLPGLQVKVMNGSTVVGFYAVNADGSFRTPRLPPLPQGSSYKVYAVYGNLTSPELTPGFNWTPALRTISGAIAGLTGSPTVTITASSVTGQLQKTVTFTGNGSYAPIENLVPASDYIVSVTGAGLPVTYFNGKTDIGQATAIDISGGNFTTADFDFTIVNKGAIGGTITENSAGVANIGVYAFETTSFALTQVSADGSGVYSITLPPGTYEIFVINANNKTFYYKDGVVTQSPQSEAAATKVVLAAGGDLTGKGIDITECTNVLTGKVTYKRADGDPAVNVLVTATSSGGNGIAITGQDGSYSLSGLCAGTYRVEMNPLNGKSAVQSATVTVPATIVQNFVIDTGYLLSGKITDSSAVTTTIENAMIYLLDQQTGMLVNGRMYFSNGTGDYEIADIPYGIDTLNVTHPLYRAYSEPNVEIPIPDGTNVKNVQLIKGAYFNITVKDGSNSNALLPGALVIVTRVGAVPVYALTDVNGNCKIFGLDLTKSDYIILAQKAGFERKSLVAQTPSNSGVAVEFILNRPAALFNLSGTITSDCATPNLPVAGAYVLVSTTAKDFFASAITDANGQYIFTNLPQAADYRFVVVPGGALKTQVQPVLNYDGVATGTLFTNNVAVPCGNTITGTVTRTGTTPISVFLYTAGNQFVGFTEANATTGVYTFTGITASTTYKVLAVSQGFSPKWYNSQTTIDAANPVSAGGVNVDITLTP
jgi:hypothetical protein